MPDFSARMYDMSSRLDEFNNTEFDVLVVGGGIYGTSLAWEATRQGLRVALIEKKDFGHATSSSSLKIMHGGLRYLQQLDLIRMRHSISSRRRGFILAPNLLHPAPFMVPTVKWGLQHKLLMTAAFLMNDTISFDRNKGVGADWKIGMGHILGHDRVKDLLDGVACMDITGAAVWQDGFVENTERFTYAFAKTAEMQGAVIANYVKATGLLHSQGQIEGVRIQDEDTGEEGAIRAKVVINAAGPWLPDLLPPGAEARHAKEWAWTRGYNIIVNRNLFGKYGIGVEGRADDYDTESVVQRTKRNFFFAPWHNRTLIGTIYKRYQEKPDDASLAPEEIEAFIKDVNALYPPAELTLDDVVFSHVGILPAPYHGGRTDSADPSRETLVIDYGKLGLMKDLYAVRGVKYTTAIDVARKLIRHVASRQNWTLKEAADDPLYGSEQIVSAGDIQRVANRKNLALSDEVCRHLKTEYGPHFWKVLQIATEEVLLASPLTDTRPVLGAEVVYAVRCEHARHLEDVILRRTLLGPYGYPGTDTLKTTAVIMGRELEWSKEQQDQEIDAVIGKYKQLGLAHTVGG